MGCRLKGLAHARRREYHCAMIATALRKQVFAAAMAGAALATLLALALAPQNAASRAVFDAIAELCSGLATDASAGAHERTPGLYMPMFSTPPKGGPIYNGPPLDDC
jgi:hypothetical protein